LAFVDRCIRRHAATYMKSSIYVTAPSHFQDIYAPWTSVARFPRDYGSGNSFSDTDCSLACSLREQNGKG